jgi:hypothetical protein
MALSNGEAVERVAREFVARYGKAKALRLLREHVEVARGQGDEPSAKAWDDIADFAEVL